MQHHGEEEPEALVAALGSGSLPHRNPTHSKLLFVCFVVFVYLFCCFVCLFCNFVCLFCCFVCLSCCFVVCFVVSLVFIVVSVCLFFVSFVCFVVFVSLFVCFVVFVYMFCSCLNFYFPKVYQYSASQIPSMIILSTLCTTQCTPYLVFIWIQ